MSRAPVFVFRLLKLAAFNLIDREIYTIADDIKERLLVTVEGVKEETEVIHNLIMNEMSGP